MDWTQVGTFIGINIALFGAIAGLIIWTVTKHDSEIKSIVSRLDATNSRLDGHASRIDQLYQMFVDLIKEGRK